MTLETNNTINKLDEAMKQSLDSQNRLFLLFAQKLLEISSINNNNNLMED